ncbi:UNVERIFIED_CONTAM: hypothetical protein FKN15_043380 [Acipenser sinensis]
MSQLETAMAMIMKTFDKYSGADDNKGCLSKAELKTLMEKEFPSFLKTADTKPGLQGEASPDLQRTTSTSTESTAPAPEHPVRNRVGSELLFRDCNPLVLLLVIPIAG